MPEGVEVDSKLLEEFGGVAAKHGLNQEAAQALIELHTKTLQEAAVQPYKLWNETQTKWQDEIKADATIGGDKLDANLQKVSKVLDQFGGQEVREALGFTGAGNNPAIARFLVKVANTLVEGGHIAGIPKAGPPPKGAQALYPGLPPG